MAGSVMISWSIFLSCCVAESTNRPTTASTEASSTEVKQDSGAKKSALVIGWVLVVVLFAILLGAIIAHYRRKKQGTAVHFKRARQRSQHEHHQETDVDLPAYMDLKKRNTRDESGELKEIPEKNVNYVSTFPGQGLTEYRRVNISRHAGDEDAVMKILSDKASIALWKLWLSEIKSVLNLPKHSNVVYTIGWCNAVPQFLLTELVFGGNLSQHLSENFSPHKTHQYGNVKRKKFQVQERGNLEILPRFALDVSRGLRFLLNNEFIHPGLRARKVLVDSSGRCQLYDFLSTEGSNEVTSLLWAESVPYQWMSPEYLLLGTLSPAGDVWSFGVLLWEIFSFGTQPFAGEGRDVVEAKLRKLDRLPMPANCPGAIWNLMTQCWEQSPEQRPRLDEISTKLSTMCNDDKEYAEISPNQA